MRYRLLHLIYVVSAVAVYLGIAQSAGYWVAAGVVLAFALVAWSLFSVRHPVPIGVRLAGGCIGFAAFWFLAVDWSWFIEECPECYVVRDIDQYRVLGYSIYTRIKEHPTVIGRSLDDLGAPCLHEHLERWHKHRWWGLLACGLPCWNGISSLSADDDRYTDKLSARLRKRGRKDPLLAAELHRRIVELHDYEYFWDAFMVDEMSVEWVDSPETHEAISWLTNSSTTDGRTVNMLTTSEDSIKMVRAGYEAGAVEVLVIEIEDFGADGNQAAGALLIKLPQEEKIRQRVLAWVDRNDSNRETPRTDYGQTYVHFYP